ncbi:MAG TPA: flavodoxin domain-containing protein [Nitrososphaerales archaeon]|nr:flavodoxin domain-containing protein [Nitrososphaerales archaeon]
MKACVVFDTRYGNTERIAKSVAIGLEETGIEACCAEAKGLTSDSLEQYDLICVGAPTEWLTASKPMKQFLEGLHREVLSGKYGFAFDTKLARPLSGSASGYIEKEFGKVGIQIIAGRESAIVYGTGNSMSSMSSMRLKDGEEQRFEGIGREVGAALATRVGKIQV